MPERKRPNHGKKIAATLLILGAVGLAVGAVRFLKHRRAYALSDAVFVGTDSLVTVSVDRVSGQLLELRKREGDPVEAGEVLAVIDDATYRRDGERLEAAIRAAEAELSAKGLERRRLETEFGLSEKLAASRLRQAEKDQAALVAKAAALTAEIDQLDQDRKRFDALYAARAVARRQAEEATTRLTSRQEEKKAVLAQAEALRAAVDAAQLDRQLAENQAGKLTELDRDMQAAAAKVNGLTAELSQAQADIAACTVRSPLSGRVAKSYLSTGAVVAPKKALLALVDPKDVFIIALLEENKLQGVQPGAQATVTVDAYPDRRFQGEVSRILPASAATFALAPRDISAGEFTKVAQRIPVRITVSAGDRSLLRVGMGGEVEIKRQGDGP